MNIGIIGQGFVGNAVFQKFRNFFNVLTYDLDNNLCNSTFEIILDKCKIIFLCLPTPMNKDGSCYIGFIESELEKINNLTNATVILKSTIPPNTTKYFSSKYQNISIFFNPEFLTEANAVNDFENQKRIIIGGNSKKASVVKNIFETAFPNAEVFITDSSVAEMVKYLTNVFLATKVSFANEFFKLCGKLEIDYNQVINLSVKDERLGNSHWMVPGPDGDYGFGGHCFPKDISAILFLMKKFKSIDNLTSSVVKTNNEVRKNRDWEEMKGRATL